MAEKLNVWKLLQKRYPEGEYTLMAEVSDMAGHSRSRSADYIVVSLWPSRGLSITGIEVKANRSDWLKELCSPAKAESIAQNCDFFWLLTTHENVAKLDEIPTNWGLMVIQQSKAGNYRLVIMKGPVKLTPKPLSMHFVAAMLKRASDKKGYVHTDDIDERLKQERQWGRDESKRIVDSLRNDCDRFKEDITEFEKASGIKFGGRNSWDGIKPEKIGAAIKMLADGGPDLYKQQLLHLEGTAKRICEGISSGLSIFEENIPQNHETTNTH